MADVTKKEQKILYKNICPDCGGHEGFIQGPFSIRGFPKLHCAGICMNIMCANEECQAKFNLPGIKGIPIERLEYGKGIKHA